MEKQELFQKIQRFRSIGEEIAELVEESKGIRKEIGEAIGEFGIEVNEETPVKFLLDETVVSIQKSGKDFTILFEDISKI